MRFGVSFNNAKSAGWVTAIALSAAVNAGFQLKALANEPGWVLTQSSTKMGGQYVYISPGGMRLVNPKQGFNLVTHAPNWDITMFNEKTHCYYKTTIDGYKRELAGQSQNDLQSSTWFKAGAGSILGLRATEYKMNGRTVQHKNAKGQITQSRIDGAQCWVATDIQVPPKLVDLIATAYGLPNESTFPLRVTYLDNATAHTVLDTYRCNKTSFPANYFEMPGGYKPVKSAAEVMMNDEQKQIMDDMARDLGGDSQGAQLKQKLDNVRAGNTTAGAANFSKDDVNRLLNSFQKTKQNTTQR